MLTVTSLKHPTTQAKLLGAMQSARLMSLRGGFIKDQGRIYIKKAKGEVLANGQKVDDYYLRVTHYRGDSNAFEFYHLGNNVTKTVLKSLRA